MENPKAFTRNIPINASLVTLERGKIPPQATDLEEVVLGAMLIDKKGVDEVIDILHPEVFYKTPIDLFMKRYSHYLKHLNPLIY